MIAITSSPISKIIEGKLSVHLPKSIKRHTTKVRAEADRNIAVAPLSLSLPSSFATHSH